MAERNVVKPRTCEHCKAEFQFTAKEIKKHVLPGNCGSNPLPAHIKVEGEVN